MAITKVINDAVDLNQTSDYSGLRLPVGTTGNVVESFTTDYLVIGGGGSGSLQGAGGAGGLRTSYNNSTTTTNSLNFPSGKTAIATYMLDNNATDVSQNYDGAETNISYNTGQYGGAAIFNGSSSYIELPASVGQLNNYTFSAWFNTGSLGVIQCLYSYNNPSTPRSFIFLNSGGTNNIRVYSQNTNYYSSNNIYVANQWYHIAYTKSSTNGITVYLNNNVIINDSSATSNDIATTAGDNRLGGYKTSSPSSYFDGSIDQVRIYNTELSGTDVSNIYNNEVQALSGGGTAAESSLTLSEGVAYDVTVGAGGIDTYTSGGSSSNGASSIFSTITSLGGGGAGATSSSSTNANGKSGGSGGGAGANTSGSPGNGTLGQGYIGGTALFYGGSYAGGGGGGALSPGGNSASNTVAGNGGSQLNLAITGTSIGYAGGGGGSLYGTGTIGTNDSSGGSAAPSSNSSSNGGSAPFNLGGGGGGANHRSGTTNIFGGSGGSGVVILRYPTASVSSFTTTGTLNTPSTTDTLVNNNYPVTNTAYYTLDGNANGYLTTNDLGTLNYPSGAGCIALYELNGNANGYLTTTDLSTVNYPSGAGCIALYELNGNANDTSNTYNGSANNITYNTGAFDQAAVFNGSSSTINLNSNISNIFTDTFTFSAWLFITDNSTYNCIFSNGYGMEIYFYQGEFQLYSNNTNNGTSRNINGFVTTTTDYAVNQWHHLALVFTKTSQSWFINGQADGTNTTASYNPFDGNSPVLGYFSPSNQWHYNGQIDQVRVFNTALTQSQITTLARGISTSYSGIENNITYDTGAFGKAAIFNGSSSYIDLGASLLSSKSAFSVSTWVNFANLNTQNFIFFNSESGTGGNVGFYDYGNGNIYFQPDASTSANRGYISNSGIYTTDEWVHIVMVFDGSATGNSNRLKAYIQGTERTLTYDGTIPSSSGTSTCNSWIGGRSSTKFSGDIDQVRIFNTALTQSQVTTLARGTETAYNGAESNMTWQNGRFDKCAKFNGSNTYIDLPLTSLFGGKNTLSVSFWFKTTTTGRQRMFTDYAQTSRNCDITIDAGALEIATDYNQNPNLVYTSSAIYNDGNWHHLVVALNQSLGQRTIYIDGLLMNTGNLSTNSWSGSGQKVTLGAFYSSSSGYSGYFDGEIDQLRVFNIALSNSNVTDLYKEHYQTKFTDGSDTAIVFTEGTGTVTFNGTNASAPQGAIRANTSYSEDGSSSVIEHYNGAAWKYFDAVKYCTTNTLNFPTGAGCIASYNLDNNVNDIGNTYNGINSNVTFNASGKFGAAAVFNGSSSRITLPSGSPFNSSNSVKSISAWIKPNTLTSRIFSYAASSSSNSQSYFQVGWFNDLSFIRINVTQGNSSVYSRYQATITPTTDWVHILVQVTGTGKEIYVNGVEVSGTYTNSGGGSNTDWIGNVSSINNHTIGISRLDTPSYSDGSIDQVRIFNDSLTSNEISKLYNNEIACS